MAKRRREGGLTLIEILLALLVMVLGLLGILAVFPPTLQSSRESVEETTAAILAESIGHSFKNAVMFGKYDVATSKWTCVMAHDLKKGNNLFVRYSFVLPTLADHGTAGKGWRQYPSSAAAPSSADEGQNPPNLDPTQDQHFDTSGDQWAYATVDSVHRINDPTDPYWQYAFSFVVKKINSLEYLLPGPGRTGQINPATGNVYNMKDLEPMTKLYEIRVRVFRVATQLAAAGGGTGTGGGSTTSKELIAEVNYRVGTK
jgi:type II secretory pathway pseudopilin PulG